MICKNYNGIFVNEQNKRINKSNCKELKKGVFLIGFQAKKYPFYFFGHFVNVKNKRIELCVKTKQLRTESMIDKELNKLFESEYFIGSTFQNGTQFFQSGGGNVFVMFQIIKRL